MWQQEKFSLQNNRMKTYNEYNAVEILLCAADDAPIRRIFSLSYWKKEILFLYQTGIICKKPYNKKILYAQNASLHNRCVNMKP